MKQSLQLRLGQQLTMTPQLQQAIRLLQLSSIELKQEIQEALESNIMLEVAEDNAAPEVNDEAKAASSEDQSITASSDKIPEELPLDTSWEDVYDNVYSTLGPADSDSEYAQQNAKPEGLHEHLQQQLELARFSDRDRTIAAAIIDTINEEGYLSIPLIELCHDLGSQLEALELDEVEAVLHQVQNFDPPGVAAQNLGECLAIQLRQLPPETPWRREAFLLVTDHLKALGDQNIAAIKKALQVSDSELEQIIALVRSLNPYPGSEFSANQTEYVVPDVFVFKKNGRWEVSLNPEVAPKLRINPYYSNMIKRADNSEDNQSMKNHLQEARWFLRSLQSRTDTLLRVAHCIVERQQEFLEHGEIAMKPMVLRDIAETLNMHESTVSRVTSNKYMHTPNGIYEFKYFFSSHVSTQSGGECSATAIKAFIKELVDHENPAKPLSDQKISKLLQEKGINVARRTVAKYREALGIPSSSQRKRLL